MDETKRFLTSNFILVGVTERLLEFKVLLAQLFSIPAARVTADHVNAGSPSRPRIDALLSASERAQVEARNALDMELHRWAHNNALSCTRAHSERSG